MNFGYPLQFIRKMIEDLHIFCSFPIEEIDFGMIDGGKKWEIK